MADYAPNFTARYKVTYSFEGDTHVNVTRWSSANTLVANVADALAFWTAFLAQTEELRHTSFDIVGAEYAAADTNVFLPVAMPSEANPGLRTTETGASGRIMHSIWQGRSNLGARCRFQMFGLAWATAEDDATLNFYITNDENPVVGAVAEEIQTSGMVGPDDETIALVRARVAYKQNDAWVNNRRRGAS